LNTSADPYFPDADHVPFETVPVLPFPDESPTTVPDPSLNEYAATSDADAAGAPAGRSAKAVAAATTATIRAT